MSSPSQTCRLVIDGPSSGAWNMAVDEVLLASAGEAGIATLRFYLWGKPTVSLGYFQPHQERRGHRASRDFPWLRRASGGGAIVHDRELTYSLALPLAGRLARPAGRLYDEVHGALIEVLAGYGILARPYVAGSPVSSAQQPFLCFQRHQTGDLLVGEHKIAGSAQRRHGGAILQHGSLLLARSPAAPELDGIAEVCGKNLAEPELILAATCTISSHVQLGELAEGELSAKEKSDARQLAVEKYGCNWWNAKR